MLAPQWKAGLSFQFLLGSFSMWGNVPLCRLESCWHRQTKRPHWTAWLFCPGICVLPSWLILIWVRRNLQKMCSGLQILATEGPCLPQGLDNHGSLFMVSMPYTVLLKPCVCLPNKYIFSINTVIYPLDTPGWHSLLEPTLPRPLLLA